MANPPYGIISAALRRGEVVPFLGAGVNFGARQKGSRWESEASGFLPSGAELAQYLARLSEFPSTEDQDRTDLAKVSAYFSEVGGRHQLLLCLRSIFDRTFEPCQIHNCLAEIAASVPLLILTTNYDDLLERALIQQRYDLVTHITDCDEWAEAVLLWRHEPGDPAPRDPKPYYPGELDKQISLGKVTAIYKMHGAVDRLLNKWDSYVITEDDYVDFLARMSKKTAIPSAFNLHFGRRQFLFLGYGLRDWNLRLILRDLFLNRSRSLGPSWAIQIHPSPLEKRLWDARGVDIYDVDVEEFARELRAAMAGDGARR